MDAARSTHHRVAWLARESSKPGRERIERWTLQASATWSQEHLRDDAPRIEAKLLRALEQRLGYPVDVSPSPEEITRKRSATPATSEER